ncbi:hypothetical protein UFOVP117_90 [uncultured Caudovirales phage]|jgi:hypothetical protein|uniref:Uncharacterized protein n=1 Tax=uncultured Caudovirales phage TaxID=2100421 RepID=A0A6J5L6N2_9CAUD|nr:hypothetical protein UFOVP117_90 [uncultured Caudovirales phage]
MIMMSLTSFSQIDTGIKDTTKVVISSQVARKIVKDLIRLDGCIEENQQLYSKISLLENREGEKDKKIEIFEEKDKNNQIIIGEKDKQIGLYVDMTNDLKDEIKTNNDKTKWWKVGTYAGGGLTLLLLILAF